MSHPDAPKSSPPGPLPYESQAPPPSGHDPFSVIAFCCGLGSLLMGCPLSIAAIVTGWIAMKRQPGGLGKIGFTLGVVTLSLNLLVACLIFGFYGTLIGISVDRSVRYEELAAAREIARQGQDAPQEPPEVVTARAMAEAAEIVEREFRDRAYPSGEAGSAAIAHVKDGWGAAIAYRPTRDEHSFFVVSPGPDGQFDTPDDLHDATTDFANIDSPTERALAEAVDLLEQSGAGSDPFPSETEGAAMISHLRDEWGAPLVYRPRLGQTLFVVLSPGPDGAIDTEDDRNHFDDYVYSNVSNRTERGMFRAVDAIERVSAFREPYPADGVGDAIIADVQDEWGNPLSYRQIDEGESFRILSAGPDGRLDTEDDLHDGNYPYTQKKVLSFRQRVAR